jgi:uridylate kinase
MKPKLGRVVLKVSGEALSSQGTSPIDFAAADRLAGEIKGACDSAPEIELSVVVGGGNIMRARQTSDSEVDRTSADYAGMLATAINAVILADRLAKGGAQARVMSAIEMKAVAETFTVARADKLLKEKRILILCGGTGSPYFTTDTAAALRASELRADAVLKGTNVDGVYDDDPKVNPGAKLFGEIDYADALSRRLRVMDLTAFSLCMENKIPIIVFNMEVPGNLAKVLSGERVGTLVGRLERQ